MVTGRARHSVRARLAAGNRRARSDAPYLFGLGLSAVTEGLLLRCVLILPCQQVNDSPERKEAK